MDGMDITLNEDEFMILMTRELSFDLLEAEFREYHPFFFPFRFSLFCFVSVSNSVSMSVFSIAKNSSAKLPISIFLIQNYLKQNSKP